ncbi:hypothetical protein SDC9_98337 [bioreactor metagenome]|uniref:Uncharacterized protein n=1 Tax=bioreactor metagenome TaxID=1076179 RepID=A0A645AFV2_9ZZZZ
MESLTDILINWIEEFKTDEMRKMENQTPGSTVQYFYAGEIAACEKCILQLQKITTAQSPERSEK